MRPCDPENENGEGSSHPLEEMGQKCQRILEIIWSGRGVLVYFGGVPLQNVDVWEMFGQRLRNLDEGQCNNLLSTADR